MNLLILFLLPIIYDVVRSEHVSTFTDVFDLVAKYNTLMEEQIKTKEYDRPRFKVYTEQYVSTDYVTFYLNETIQFSDVRENVKGCYNSSTSVFQAPVSGLYLFYIGQTEPRGDLLQADIVRGNGHEIIGFLASYILNTKNEVYVIANLDADEDVWIECAISQCWSRYGFYLMFSGVLLQEL
ncbi:hypothetical protein CHS0354_017513 [Potamilus streckersoni]|uniref:C1q domain-containing protein n=1 Tax=Potamilus streckersoni TaxID=2493646 RepID=A0AAE0S799_9BIVA|nr:hypothetical protein CHS0354_017513 [Potamilus streckersoni]